MRRVTLSMLLIVASAGAIKAEQPAVPKDARKGIAVPVEQGGNLLFVRAKINGRDAGYFIVDTGATDTTLDNAVAKRLRLPVTGHAKAFGAIGSSIVSTHSIRSLALGDARFKLSRVISADLGLWQTALGVPVSGLLGGRLFSQRPFTLDYRTSTLTFHEKDQFTPPADGRRIAVVVKSELIFARVRIDRKWEGRMMLDTGVQNALNIAPAYAAAHRDILVGRKGQPRTIGGLGGRERKLYAMFNHVELFGKDIGRIDVMIPGKIPATGNAQRMGVVGGAVLKQFRLTFDYSANTLWAKWDPEKPIKDSLATTPNVNKRDFLGATKLWRAARYGDLAAVKLLLNARADPRIADKRGITPLRAAVTAGNRQIVELLQKAGARR